MPPAERTQREILESIEERIGRLEEGARAHAAREVLVAQHLQQMERSAAYHHSTLQTELRGVRDAMQAGGAVLARVEAQTGRSWAIEALSAVVRLDARVQLVLGVGVLVLALALATAIGGDALPDVLRALGSAWRGVPVDAVVTPAPPRGATSLQGGGAPPATGDGD